MIANPDKFYAVLVTKGRDDRTGVKVMIQGKQIQSENAVRLLGVKFDHRLTFNDHISNLCRKAAAQLIALKRLEVYMEFNAKEIPLVWLFPLKSQ